MMVFLMASESKCVAVLVGAQLSACLVAAVVAVTANLVFFVPVFRGWCLAWKGRVACRTCSAGFSALAGWTGVWKPPLWKCVLANSGVTCLGGSRRGSDSS